MYPYPEIHYIPEHTYILMQMSVDMSNIYTDPHRHDYDNDSDNKDRNDKGNDDDQCQ